MTPGTSDELKVGTDGPATDVPVDHRSHVSDYFRLERWELPSSDGDDRKVSLGGRAPIDQHHRGLGGGMRTGGLLTNLDSLGGFASGLAVLPLWIVTTSLLVTVSVLDHTGPLRFRADVLRRGRSSVVTALDVVDEGAGDRPVAAATMTCAILDPGAMELDFPRPFSMTMPPFQPDLSRPEEFFCIEPGSGPVTRLHLEDRLRNPWGILHGGAVAMLADEAACRAAVAHSRATSGPNGVVAADTVLHYLRPVKVGPVEARCRVLGSRAGRTTVRIEINDVGSDGRTVTFGSVTVLAV